MIDLMTHDDFQLLLQSNRQEYYTGRWEYFKEVIGIIKQLHINNVLELGPGLMPIVKNADIMLNPSEDQFGQPTNSGTKIINFDATRKPWPIKDKEYDLFIALQVWEHLDNKQCRAFREVMRISKMAILSFPFNWGGGLDNPMHRAHRNVDLSLIQDWTLNIKPAKQITIERTGEEFSKGPRMICFWVF